MYNEIMVSVVCYAYNHAKYIRKTLEGFINQKTNFNFEVLIHDDASTDNTADIIREYEKKYPNIIKPIYQTENQYSKGISIGRTYVIPKTKGKYIAWCEGDDYWCDENKLQMQFDVLEHNADASMCVHDVRIIKETGELTDLTFPNRPIDKETLSTKDFLMSIVTPMRNYIFQTSCYFAKAEYAKISDENVPEFMKTALIGDIPFLLHMILKGNIIYIKREMSHYRQNSVGSWSNTNIYNKSKHTEHLLNVIEIYKKYNEYTNKKYDVIINRIILQRQLVVLRRIPEAYPEKFLTKDKLYERTKRYFTELKQTDKKFALWGNGAWGNSMCTYLKQHDVFPDYIIDNNTELQGKYTKDNIPIVNFENIKTDCNIIIVSIYNNQIYQEIRNKINKENPNIEVLFFDDFFTLKDEDL